jgi:hypothetical protein
MKEVIDEKLEGEMLKLINDYNDQESSIIKRSKQEVKQSVSHSEQRESDTPYTDLIEDNFSPKKGKGSNPNSRKNLVPFKKGQSGNPGGKPVKYAQLRKMLDEWGNKTEDTTWNWDELTHREAVIKGIWKRASNGNRQDLDTLLQLGLLDEDTFK